MFECRFSAGWIILLKYVNLRLIYVLGNAVVSSWIYRVITDTEFN